MRKTNTAHAANSSFIDPGRLYTREGFCRAAGIAKTRLREARLQGLEPEWLLVGKRYYLHGHCAINFIEKLAELTAEGRDS